MDTNPQFIERFEEIADRYEGLICDIWGVVHNGLEPWPDACAALIAFRKRGGKVVLLSNSPRPSDGVQRQLARIGVPADVFDDSVTSGDLTRALLLEDKDARIHHLGPEHDNGIYRDLTLDLVSSEDANRILVTGLMDDDTEKPEDYQSHLDKWLARDVLMLCANPDLVVERGDRLVYCAGALADLYERQGGRVIWAGKPHAPAYEAVMTKLNKVSDQPLEKKKVLAIGDSLRTDIAGGVGFGVDTLFVAAGIHTAEITDDAGAGERVINTSRLMSMVSDAENKPRYVMTGLR